MTDKARVCAAIRESTTAEAVQAMSRAAGLADLVEVRADFVQDLDVAALLAAKPCPVLFTLRSSQEGGDFAGAERVRLETIVEAANLGADYVDVEFSAYWKAVLDAVPPERVILSSHNFEETPADLGDLFDRMSGSGAGIIKIATRANRLSDNVRIMRLLERAASKGTNLVALAMGRPGIPSRILGPSRGSWMTFASLPGSAPTADGQVRADDMLEVYRIQSITRSTRIYGVAGRPIGHSLSPQVHNRAFAERGLDAVYVPLEADGVGDLMEFADYFGLEGASVTIPFKEDIRELVTSISVEAEQVGAVNTIVRAGSGWHGENTDVEGFLYPLKRRTFPGRLNSVVLGAGGAARAVVAGLRAGGSRVCVVARDVEKARRLAQPFGASWKAWGEFRELEWDLLVNTTPVGMYPSVDETPVPADCLKGEWVYDLVYRPAETRLLREAAARGCRTISGIDMFLGQAVKQQQIWCGTPVPHKEMAEALETALGRGRPAPGRPEETLNA
jgi:3-dehydroquinate dehydratase / shikimate dehydrogenase